VDDRVEPVRHPFDDVGETDRTHRLPHLPVAGVRAGKGDVVAQRAGEQERLLRDNTKLAAQRAERHAA